MSGLDIALWLSIGAVWGWCAPAMKRRPVVKVACDHSEREIILGRKVTEQVESVLMKMACVGVGENGTGYIVEERASITIPGKGSLILTLRGETA